MKYIIFIATFFAFGAIILADGKTQYPSAPAVVAKEQPTEETWTTKPIIITDQDLRRHAAILSESRDAKTSEWRNSEQVVKVDNTKIKRIPALQLPTKKVASVPSVAKLDPNSKTVNELSTNSPQKLLAGGENWQKWKEKRKANKEKRKAF